MIDWCGLPITLKTVIVHDILKGANSLKETSQCHYHLEEFG